MEISLENLYVDIGTSRVSDGPKVSVFETVDSSLLTQAYGYAGS